MTSQSQDLLDACASGDIAVLQRLFDANNIRGSKPVYISSSDKPPPANEMLEASITNGHLDIVLLILGAYKETRIRFYGQVIDALLEKPNLDIMEALYNYDNSIVSFEWDDHTNTFFTKACKQPSEKITPLLHFLIDHNADLEAGYFPRPVYNAIVGGQTLSVIESMVKKGSNVSTTTMRQAIVCERVDVVRFFMGIGVEGDRDDAQYLRSEAEKTGNIEIVELVHEWTGAGGWGNGTEREYGYSSVLRKLKSLFKGKG
jgi:hypothetical protein